MAYAVENFDNLANANAIVFIRALRHDYSGLTKCYGVRYLRALAKVCKYECNGNIVIMNSTTKEFKNNKEAGQWMEQKINDLFDLGVL